MRFGSTLVGFGLMLTLCSFPLTGCGSDGSGTGGVGGTAGSGASGGGGGAGGIGGGGGDIRSCVIPGNCDDQEPCTMDLCVDQVCMYEPLPDDSVCASETGLSLCLDATCEPIWLSCGDEGAQEGDFCQPADDMSRTGRCALGVCEVGPCEISLDCWDGNICTVGVCDSSGGTCSQDNAANGTQCVPPVGGQCLDGLCEFGGGQGGAGGQGGQGGQGGA